MRVTVIAGNGLGGTEKAAFIYAAELARRGHQVCALTSMTGPRTSTLLDAAVAIHEIPYETEALKRHFDQFAPDIIHQHVSGYGDQRTLYNAMDQCKGKRPKVIETNVFGRLMDRYDNGHVSFRMFVSMASGCQAFRRPCIRPIIPSADKHSILSNPLPDFEAPSDARRAAIREELGVADSDILWIRVGRPAGKWTSWDCDAFARARRRDRRLRLLLMEPTPAVTREIEAGRWGDGIQIKRASSDFHYLAELYGSADAMIHASNFGESYGYTLAEGMQAGLPIVTLSTPWGDSGQIQLVEHNGNGFVCCSVHGMTEAMLEICRNHDLRKRMSVLARTRIAQISNRSRDVDLLEQIMIFVTGGSIGQVMQGRFSEWMEYRQVFESAENDLYERDLGLKIPVIRWKAYGKYRIMRSGAREALERLRLSLATATSS